jgi:hypothetical protein
MVMTATPVLTPLEDLMGQILSTGRITDAHRYQLMLTLIADGLNQEDCILLDRLFYGVRKGLLKLD